MLRTLLSCLLALSVVGSVSAQSGSKSADHKGTFLGILFSPVPDSVYAQVPLLNRDCGVIVTHVLPDSPAAKVNLARHDIVLEYNGEKVRDSFHLAKLIRADKPGATVNLKYLRAGKEETSKLTLVLGPELQLAEPTGTASPMPQEPPRTSGKPGGPPAVTISAAPLENNRLQLDIEYYNDAIGRYQSLRCAGAPDEIDTELKKLPAKLQDTARQAVKRVRELGLQKPEPRSKNSE